MILSGVEKCIGLFVLPIRFQSCAAEEKNQSALVGSALILPRNSGTFSVGIHLRQ